MSDALRQMLGRGQGTLPFLRPRQASPFAAEPAALSHTPDPALEHADEREVALQPHSQTAPFASEADPAAHRSPPASSRPNADRPHATTQTQTPPANPAADPFAAPPVGLPTASKSLPAARDPKAAEPDSPKAPGPTRSSVEQPPVMGEAPLVRSPVSLPRPPIASVSAVPAAATPISAATSRPSVQRRSLTYLGPFNEAATPRREEGLDLPQSPKPAGPSNESDRDRSAPASASAQSLAQDGDKATAPATTSPSINAALLRDNKAPAAPLAKSVSPPPAAPRAQIAQPAASAASPPSPKVEVRIGAVEVTVPAAPAPASAVPAGEPAAVGMSLDAFIAESSS